MDEIPHEMISQLRASTRTDWKLKVRVTRIWPGLNHNGETVVVNFIFVDVLGGRVHALISAHLFQQLVNHVLEGQTYEIKNFVVMHYSAGHKYRCFRNDIFVKLNHLTEVRVAVDVDFIPAHVFEFTDFEDLFNAAAQDDFLIDVVGIVERVQPLSNFTNKYNQQQSFIRFTLNDMFTSTAVILYDEMAVSFAEALNNAVQHPSVVIISSCRAHFMNGVPNLTNLRPTRFFINYNHEAVEDLRDALRLAQWRNDD